MRLGCSGCRWFEGFDEDDPWHGAIISQLLILDSAPMDDFRDVVAGTSMPRSCSGVRKD